MAGNPTIKDVARIAGVSVRTVSRVLNNHPYVRYATRKRVQEAIESLRYHPNPMARIIGGGSSNSIGVVVGQEPRVVFSNPFLFEVLGGIGSVASQVGYPVMLHTAVADGSYLDLFRSRQVGGLIFMSVPDQDPQVYEVIEEGYPAVLTCPFDGHEQSCYVDVDNERGAYLAVQHLLIGEHTQIGFLNGPRDYGSSHARFAGYRRAMEEHGVGVRSQWVLHGDFSEESGYRLAGSLLSVDRNVTAIFVSGDLMAIGALKALAARGVRVPDDMAVVGFDDISLARYVDPPLTTVRQPAFEKGATAVQLLTELMQGSQPPERRVLLTPELVVRNTSSSQLGADRNFTVVRQRT